MERLYESMVILRSDTSDEEKSDVFNRITKKIEELKGTVKNAKIWAKERSFAFPLISTGSGKKRHLSGCYWLVEFNIDGESLGELKELLRLDERVLRSMILKKED